MEKNTTTITRRIFNKLILSFSSIIPFIGSSSKADVIETEPEHEILITPEEFRKPYSPKTKEILYNHIKSGHRRKEIRNNIINKMSNKIRIK